MARFVEVDNLGRVLIERSRKSRNINIYVAPFSGVRVAVPYGVSFSEAEEAVSARTGWIRKQLNKMRKVENEYDPASEMSSSDKSLAEIRLVNKARYLAQVNGFFYNKITVRSQKTRWGSCSHRNNINLNVKLVRLPEELMNYVILHELMHTRIKAHNAVFWGALERVVKGAKALDKRLRGYYPELL